MRKQRPRDRFGRPQAWGAPNELADRREPDVVVSSVDEALRTAARLFDQQRFFEAHEFLEWIWKSEQVPTADRDYWKGVTQVAVGYVHTQRGNASGAFTLLQRALRHLAPYPSPYRRVDRDALAAGAHRVMARIAQIGASPDVNFPPFPLLPDASSPL